MIFKYHDISNAILAKEALKDSGIKAIFTPNHVLNSIEMLCSEKPIVHLIEVDDNDTERAKAAISKCCLPLS